VAGEAEADGGERLVALDARRGAQLPVDQHLRAGSCVRNSWRE
jgi:hypothetical protein